MMDLQFPKMDANSFWLMETMILDPMTIWLQPNGNAINMDFDDGKWLNNRTGFMPLPTGTFKSVSLHCKISRGMINYRLTSTSYTTEFYRFRPEWKCVWLSHCYTIWLSIRKAHSHSCVTLESLLLNNHVYKNQKAFE